MTDETSFTNEEIEHYTARFKFAMDLKREHYTKKEHQDCRDNPKLFSLSGINKTHGYAPSRCEAIGGRSFRSAV
eukprot:COSAG01_NODE_10641_length_2114_cov_3.199504_1_plen_73_part_10